MRDFPLIREFLLAMSALVLMTVFAYLLIPHDQLLAIVVMILIIEPILALIGTSYQWWIWIRGKDRPRSWLLFYFAFLSTLISIGLFAPAYFAVRNRLGAPPLDPVDSGIVLAFGIGLIGSAPPVLAILFWHVRRSRGTGAPPPFSERD